MDCLVPFSFSFIISLTSVYASSCSQMVTCGPCIQENPQCTWCADENLDETVSRCDVLSSWNNKKCAFLQSPKSILRIVKDVPLSSLGADVRDMVQLAPQEVNLSLRPGEPFKLPIRFRQAVDYPVDLYYIMDLSYTMNVHKDKLASLGGQIAEEMSSITKNFRLGFGAFVDKAAMPFISTVPGKKESPCSDDRYTCTAPFGFKNIMPLDADARKFQKLVGDAEMSGNLDSPEGGLDALMQAVVCEKPIAWRNVSRKLIVFSTDAGYHIAGDGKLAGIVKPCDGHCHLDAKGMYTESTNQDYPSIGYLNEVVSEKKVHIIFAVTGSIINTYKSLAKRLEGAGTGILDTDSKNVVKLIREHYNKISSTLILKDNAPPDIRVTYYTRCLNPRGELMKNNTCENLKVGTNVEYEVHVELKRCPKDKRQWSRVFQIWPQGIEESVIVNVDMICECDCEKSLPRPSDKCTAGNGSLVCGICSCNPKRYGRKCECGLTEAAASLDDKACYKDNTSLMCSGGGQCVCGICDCSRTESGYRFGKYCECDSTQCPTHDDQICSGNGRCACETCDCDPGWKGKACECTNNTRTCMPPNGQQLCNGNGECKCGACECKLDKEKRYIGEFCVESPACETFWPCVICHQHFNDTVRKICQGFTCNIEVILVDDFASNETEKSCVQKDEDQCKVNYKYGETESNMEKRYYLFVQKTKHCASDPPIALIAGSVIAGVVLFGLAALIVWKILTTIHDRREYVKFENERRAAQWEKSENPLYKPSTTMFTNPTYPQ